jgi:hypothetical protein
MEKNNETKSSEFFGQTYRIRGFGFKAEVANRLIWETESG